MEISRNLLFLGSWNKVSVAQLRRAMNMGGGRAGGNARVCIGLRTALVDITTRMRTRRQATLPRSEAARNNIALCVALVNIRDRWGRSCSPPFPVRRMDKRKSEINSFHYTIAKN